MLSHTTVFKTARQPFSSTLVTWCGWPASNRHDQSHGVLSAACLPVSPHPHFKQLEVRTGIEPVTTVLQTVPFAHLGSGPYSIKVVFVQNSLLPNPIHFPNASFSLALRKPSKRNTQAQKGMSLRRKLQRTQAGCTLLFM